MKGHCQKSEKGNPQNDRKYLKSYNYWVLIQNIRIPTNKQQQKPNNLIFNNRAADLNSIAPKKSIMV